MLSTVNIATEMDRILIIEDNEIDFFLLKQVFQRHQFNLQLIHHVNGKDALDFLNDHKKFDYKQLPVSVILLDLNLPGLDGRDLLRYLKSDCILKLIPIIIFSTSNSHNDVSYCYANGANSYIQKPVEFHEIDRTITDLVHYWLGTNLLPG
ncbi:MAG: response regulator [Legionellales bacterium]|nr:response regulator [Legionellales bacterium]